ncbi:hypothetical protein D1Y84_00320 [Acidipila sp. EB88]|nr:hypothetical protein D1Y84_00320 [Acidipila sp. EB88]
MMRWRGRLMRVLSSCEQLSLSCGSRGTRSRFGFPREADIEDREKTINRAMRRILFRSRRPLCTEAFLVCKHIWVLAQILDC